MAFEMVCDKYFISLLNIAYMRIGNREDALEVVQDVFTRPEALPAARCPFTLFYIRFAL